MKLLKRALSVLLAFTMCIPSSAFTFAYASQPDSSETSYTVMLEKPENGKIAFTNSDEDSMTVSQGTVVELLLIPDNGYDVDTFMLKDSSTGKTIASKQTTDNIFSFTMPAKDVTVDAKFIGLEDISSNDTEDLEDIDNDTSVENVEDGFVYEVVNDTEDFPLADDEIDKELAELEHDSNGNEIKIESSRTTNYIASKIDEVAVKEVESVSKDTLSEDAEPTIVQTETDKAGLMPTFHEIMVSYNLVDTSSERLASSDFTADDFVSSFAQMQQIYAMDNNEDCFVAFVDFGKLNGAGSGVKATFSNSDEANAISYDGVITYDAESGIAYIPKSLFYNENGEEVVVDLQAQIYVPYSLTGEDKNVISVNIENNNSSVTEVSPSQKIAVPSFDVTVTIPLVTPETASQLDISKVSLYVNDATQPLQLGANEYFYNEETGTLTIAAMPMTIYSINVVIDGTTMVEKVLNTVTTETHADIARQVKYESDIKLIPDLYLDIDYNALQINHSETIDSNVSYQTSSAMSTSDKKIVEKYFEYLCYVGNNYENSLWAAQAIAGGSAQLGDFINESRTDFGDSVGQAMTPEMLELYNYLFTIPNLTSSSLGKNNQKLPLHSIMITVGDNAEGVGSTVASDLAARQLAQSVTIRCLSKNKVNGIQYGVFGFSVKDVNNNVAAYGIYKIPVNTPVGYIQIVKESLLPDVTEENEAYTFEGAQFQILKGTEVIKDERTQQDIFTLDASGKTEPIAVPILSPTAGETYTVKEITAPTGYEIYPEQISVNVNTSSTYASPTVARFVETPYTYDADIVIDKLDAISTYSEGNASLAGIEFEVLYYAGYGKDDFVSLHGEPTRTWTITTKERTENNNGIKMYGHTELQEEYLVTGESDPLYKDANGKVIMPLGTYVVREKSAEPGYKISGEMYVLQDNIREPNYSSNNQGTKDPAKGLIFMVKANVPQTSDYRTEIDSTGHRLADYEVYKTTGYVGVAGNGTRVTNIIRPESTITATNTVKYGGFSLQKLDYNDQTKDPQGNANDMSGLYGVKNLSDHAVTIKPENGIWINTGYASDIFVKDGITYYTFDPVADNNMAQYMFTFVTNYYGYWASSTSLLPYGDYRIDELQAPTGYQKNGTIVSYFSITEDNVRVKAPDVANMIQRGTIRLIKFDAEDQTSTNQGEGTLQGTYTVKNLSDHYVYILDNGTNEIQIIKENADKDRGAVQVTGEGTWYKFAPNTDMFTFTTSSKNGYAAMWESSPYLMPYGTYEIRETGTTDSYIISELRQGRNKATFSVTYQGEIIEFGTQNGKITDSSAIMSNPVARGGFTVEKNDADRKEHKDGSATSRLPQGDAKFLGATYKVTTNNNNYVWVKEDSSITILSENAVSSKEIDGEMWYKFVNGADMFTFRVDENGGYTSPSDMLAYGNYTITEVSASEGYLATATRTSIISQPIRISAEGQVFDLSYAKDAEDGEFTGSLYEAVIRGGVKIQKNDADVYDYMSTVAQGDATFQGAVYDIYNISNNYVWVDTNNDGTYSDDEYYKPINLNITNETELTHADVDAFTPVYTITTDKNGFAQTGANVLPYGSYLVVERTPSEGYLNGTMRDGIVAHTFQIREEGVIVDELIYDENDLEDTFYEPVIRGGFDFQKNDEETGTNVALGGADLHGTFSVTNVSDSYVWIKDEEGINLKTDGENYYYDEATGYHFYGKNEIMFTFETDETTGKFHTSNLLLPYGSYKVTEIIPPTGYLVESNRNSEFSDIIRIREEGKLFDATQMIYNYVMRGNVFFEKKDAETGIKMPYIPFLITSLDKDGQPIESHVVYTDKNGSFSSSSDYTIHSYKTNKADELVPDVNEVLDYILNEDEDGLKDYLEATDYYKTSAVKDFFENENYGMGLGVWFGVNTTPIDWERTPTLPSTGALPFGRYKLDELPCEANEGKLLVHDYFTIANEACRTTKKNNPLRYQLGAMAAGNINFGTIYNWEKPLAPQMTTDAVVRASDTQFSYTDSAMVIVDTVHYQGIDKFKDYTLVATVADAETGEFLRDITGDIAMTTEYFTPNTSDGYIKMEISVDTKGYEGRTVVVYETLYDEFGDIYVNHSDPNDERQQIHFPNLTTGVVVESTGAQVSMAESNVTVVDTVSYSNLSVGTAYNVKSYLIDAETGAVIVDASGKRVESEQPFKPTLSSGTFDVTFTFDASKLAGKKIVVCEEILENGYVISSHADKNSKTQAVWIPSVTTNIADRNTKTQMSFSENNVVITDKVSYQKVQPGLQYTVYGTLVDAANGKTVATTSTSITPSSENGSTNLTFTFNGSNYEGRTLVAYARMEYNSKVVARHEDINDEAETIYIPSIDTSAMDKENKFKLSKADNDVTIVDTVTYSNLMVGYDYIVSGYLVDASTGLAVEDASGEAISASESFNATSTSGSVDIEFNFDGSKLAGETVVVFESINVETDTDVPLVALHEDINDDNQTIRLPKLVTSAYDTTNAEHITKAGESVLKDEVTYMNVIPNVKYTMSGRLVVKDTREIIATTSVDFTPTSSTGVVNVEYTVDTSALKGKTLVFVEDLLYNGFSVAESNNLNDYTETIYVPSLTTSAIDGENGTHMSYADNSLTIVDTVNYKNLIPGKTYVMFGKVIDQETGEVLSSYMIDEEAYYERGEMHETWTCEECGEVFTSRDEVLDHIENSSTCEEYQYELYYDKIYHEEVGHYGEIAAVKPFVPTAQDGTVTMAFNFDGTGFENRTVVVYEELYMENEFGAILTDNFDCMQCGAHYNTLEDVEEHFRTSGDGCSTYSFYYTTDMFSVAEHKDRYDDEQTIHIPELVNTSEGNRSIVNFMGLASNIGAVSVANAETVASLPLGNHYIEAGKDSVVNATVTHRNLIPGVPTTIVGRLVDRETGTPTNVVASYAFVPTESTANVDLTFEFNSTEFAGRLLFVESEAYVNNGNDMIARISNATDDTMTIYVVAVDSNIKDDQTQDNTTSYGKTTITDTITVDGLKPGTEYIGTGKLMNAETGEEYKNIVVTITTDEVAKDIVVDNNTETKTEDKDDNDISVEPPVEEKEEDKSVFDWIVDSVKDFFTPTTSNQVEFTAESTSAVFVITYEIDTSTMSGDSVVSYVEVIEKEKDQVIGKHEDLEDEDQTLHIPSLTSSKIVDAYTGNKQAMLGKTAFADEVTFGNLIVGKTYTAKATLIDTETKTVLATVSEEFEATAKEGTYQLTFYVDSSKVVGKKLSVTEEIYMNGVQVALHKSDKDSDLINVAEIVTNAINEESSSQSAPVAGRTTIVDTVSYKNLIPGETYVVTGSLISQDKQEKIAVYNVTKDEEKDTNAKTEISVTFVPEKSEGSVNVSFSVDTVEMSGKSIVGYETITYNDLLVAEHKNPNDSAQTVYIPTISSTVADKDTDSKIVASSPSATIVDTIKVGNLVVGKEYTVKATLTDDKTKEVITTASKTFKATDKLAMVELDLGVNALDYAGHTLVTNDALYINDVELIKGTSHKLLVGEISTSVRDRATGISMAEFDIDTKVIDTVTYNNFVPGEEYTIYGELVSKKTGKIWDTQEVTAVFDESKGSVEVEFEVDVTTFTDRQLVAIEKVLYKGVEVASHEDFDDDKQTMNVASIGTEAHINGQKEVNSAVSTLLVDTVNYENLKPGYEYDMIGTIIDVKTGKVVECNGVPVTSTVSFVPTTSDGTVEVNFTFDTTSLKGRTVVVFEELKFNNVLIAQHNDINDAKQTVTIKDDGSIDVEPIESEKPSPSPSNKPDETESPSPSPSAKPEESEKPSPSPSNAPSKSESPSPSSSVKPNGSEKPSPSPSNKPSESGKPSPSPSGDKLNVNTGTNSNATKTESPKPTIKPSTKPTNSVTVVKPSGTTNTTNNNSTLNRGNNTSNNGTITSNNSTNSNKANIEDGVKTGDYYATIVIFIGLALAVGALGFYLLRKKKK